VTVRARTHPAAYLLHKYWSRKPHNVLRSLFERAPRGLFLDPFCGSGVALSEAAALGFECVGADVNPIARAITAVTLDPPDPRDVERVVGALLDDADAALADRYDVRGRSLRYARHATVVRCACGHAGVPIRRGRYACAACGAPVRANLESMVATVVTAVATDDGVVEDVALCAEQARLAEEGIGASRFDVAFPVNRRTLSFDGLTTRRLFTRGTSRASISSRARSTRSRILACEKPHSCS
jgi:hypothetical protein